LAGSQTIAEPERVTYPQNFDDKNHLISVNVSGQALSTLFLYDGDDNFIMQRKPDGNRTLYPSTTWYSRFDYASGSAQREAAAVPRADL
jgi:hypothetical protein